MRICFWHSDKPREHLLADAFADGVTSAGDTIVRRALTDEKTVAPDCDVACMVGVKSRELFWLHWRAGIHTIYFDKGYTRQALGGPIKIWEYWRVAVDAHQPTKKLSYRDYPSDRADHLGLKYAPWRKGGSHIVLAGSSAKYHDFYGLSDPNRYYEKVIAEIRKHTRREVVYRPKPSWRDATPLSNSRYSDSSRSIEEELIDAWALVTHGSNACFEAITAGVPCIILGDAVAKPLSSTELKDIESPRLASDDERQKWLNSLAYQQWTLREMSTGEAWRVIRPQIYG